MTDAVDEALATATVNQSNAPSEFFDSGIGWGTLDTVTVSGGELVVTLTGGSNQSRYAVADAVRLGPRRGRRWRVLVEEHVLAP